ncbi:hypothetical protein GDO81_019843 [Engystomops pustulosus]|uniref:Uncharacterized protein n=1 Tax=Engystomops pustulosus TaxID=76066 RepID=A0AAV6ZCV4_ENGPU|nr:hypothetical protein GDO81_019843 [Engystomops pustulosus]
MTEDSILLGLGDLLSSSHETFGFLQHLDSTLKATSSLMLLSGSTYSSEDLTEVTCFSSSVVLLRMSWYPSSSEGPFDRRRPLARPSCTLSLSFDK